LEEREDKYFDWLFGGQQLVPVGNVTEVVEEVVV